MVLYWLRCLVNTGKLCGYSRKTGKTGATVISSSCTGLSHENGALHSTFIWLEFVQNAPLLFISRFEQPSHNHNVFKIRFFRHWHFLIVMKRQWKAFVILTRAKNAPHKTDWPCTFLLAIPQQEHFHYCVNLIVVFVNGRPNKRRWMNHDRSSRSFLTPVHCMLSQRFSILIGHCSPPA